MESISKRRNGNQNLAPTEHFEEFDVGTLNHQDPCVMRSTGTRFRLGASCPNDTADQRQSQALVRDFEKLKERDPKCGGLSGTRLREI